MAADPFPATSLSAGSTPEERLILEGIVTSCNAEGVVNVAPMGPEVDRELKHWILKPFRTSNTFRNLQQCPRAVFHVVDDVLLLAQAAVNRWQQPPRYHWDEELQGYLLADACRGYALSIQRVEPDEMRPRLHCQLEAERFVRPFWGFNRAKHAVVEAAVLATRAGFLPEKQLRDEFARLATIVGKTAGTQERAAFDLLSTFVEESTASR